MKKLCIYYCLFLLSFAQLNSTPINYTKMSVAELNQALISAVRRRSSSEVPLLIRAGANINQKIEYYGNNYTILEYWIKDGNLSIDEFFVEDCVKWPVDQLNRALVLAVKSYLSYTVKKLIQAGAHVNQKVTDEHDGVTCTLLEYAIKHCNIHSVKALVREDYSKLSVDQLNVVLISAVKDRSSSEVQKLIQAGAHVDQKITDEHDDVTCTLLEYAVKHSDIHSVKALVGEDYSKLSVDQLNVILVPAVRNNYFDDVQKLIQAGADVNQKIKYYTTSGSGEGCMDYLVTVSILEFAVENGCKDVVHELLRGKPENDILDRVLEIAAQKGYTDIVHELLQRKPEIDILDRVLIVAVTHSNLDSIKEILQARPKIDSLDKTFNSIKKIFGLQTKVDVLDQALIVAAQNRGISIMQELVLAGADINYADKNGNTALIEFVGRSLHISSSASRNSDYIESCKQFRIHGLQYFLTISGININHANNHGNTALMRAVENSNFEAVQILLQVSNIDINHVNHDGNTALIEALQRVQTSYVSGDVNQYNRCKNSQSIVEALLKSPGIDVHHANKKGDTAIKLLDRLQKRMNGY
ncbi:MAG: ankyrin repeat domain-containing protein [Candidatus Chromulinivorax sp.]|nr:ankyrin repeat domain-containing protein [Candidatus Chromulinivorax sp.]